MDRVSQSLRLFATKHMTAENVRVALVLVTLLTLVISAGAPIDPGGPNGR